jgi:hypothetical protein
MAETLSRSRSRPRRADIEHIVATRVREPPAERQLEVMFIDSGSFAP